MADISLTSQLKLNVDAKIHDDAPLALANLKKLDFSNLPVIGDFNKAIDQFQLQQVKIGVELKSPELLISKDTGFIIGGGASASLSVCSNKQKCLFDDDQFSPVIAINPGECWAGICIDYDLRQSATFSGAGITAGTPPSGFGVSIKATEGASLGTYLRFPTAGSLLPTFKDGLTALLQTYSVPTTPGQVRMIPKGIAHTAEMSGSITLGASYSAALLVNPLATLGLPLNLALNVSPSVDATVKGSIELEGSFVVRAYRSADTKLVFGAYKKRETKLSASLTAEAGIGVDLNQTEILGKVLGAVIPAADLSALKLDDEQRNELRKALKECVNQSISLAVDAACSAAQADESAVVYELDLSGSDMTQTDEAIGSAMKGDWSKFETLATARRVRNIVRELHERKHKLSINLLGLYNATSISAYLKSTTVLHDEHGQIVITDKAEAKSLSAGTTPYAAKTDKLRSALARAFVATATYGASKGKLGLNTFTVRQSMLEYHAKATASDVRQEVVLARYLGLNLSAAWDAILQSSASFDQSKFYIDAAHDSRSVMHLFYQDVEHRTPHSPAALDQIGREAKIALLDPAAPNSLQRRMALESDEIWSAMTSNGNVASFGRTIPGLARLDETALGAIAADFLDIRWWSDALASLTPKLSAVLKAIDQSTSADPLMDGPFMAAHKSLENALADLSSATQSAFNDGWPLAVMYRVAASTGSSPSVQMDIGWNGKFEHYESDPKLALGQTSSA